MKGTGYRESIDIGSVRVRNVRREQMSLPPQHGRTEWPDSEEIRPRSDPAGLGYVIIELMVGKPLFAESRDYQTLLDKKRTLPQWIHTLLPTDVRHSHLLQTSTRRRDGTQFDAHRDQRHADSVRHGRSES